MNKKHRLIAVILVCLVAVLVVVPFLTSANIDVLNPQGQVANQQRDLIVTATLLMLIVVVPVYILTFAIAWRYRASNKKAKYSPNLDGNAIAETVWWLVPFVIIAIISGIIITSSYKLDPFRPLQSSKPPIKVQVVALQWKWLFIYPEENIASVNFVQFPANTPVNFQVTSDAPMNSFWIPSLGGQIYAMSGMSTKLHLMADRPGTYSGYSANISGRGYSGMNFKAKSSTYANYDKWLQKVRSTQRGLNMSEYKMLAKPSSNNPVKYYSSVDKNLYDTVVMKYMSPNTDVNNMEGMNH